MPKFDAKQPVASVVAAAPGTARALESHGIDTCCGGKVPLDQACAARGLDAAGVLAELEAAAPPPPESDWSTQPLSVLVDHILSVHHAFVKREIPRLSRLMREVVRAHGSAHPESVAAIARIWVRLAPALEEHLMKEEEILFPMIKALGRGESAGGCGDVGMPIRVMEWEHDEHGSLFARMRVLAGDYVPPADASEPWRALWAGLDGFERDLHTHVHLENFFLFPRARALGDGGDGDVGGA